MAENKITDNEDKVLYRLLRIPFVFSFLLNIILFMIIFTGLIDKVMFDYCKYCKGKAILFSCPKCGIPNTLLDLRDDD